MQHGSIKSLLARSAMTLLLLALLPAGRARAATVTTDRTDYTPGMTVIITGAGWQPNETVIIHLDETPDVCPSAHTWTVAADALGNFTDASFTLDVIHIGVTFDVQATGQLSGFTASAVFTDAAANLDQARNGPAASPVSPMVWVNGNLNASQAHYVEGFSVPYRMIITDLTNGSHTLVIEWDITASAGQHAIDYITHYDRLLPHNQFGAHTTPEVVNPTNGIAGVLLGPTTFPIPAPSSAGSPMPGQPTASFNALPAGERVLSIWNGTITSAVYLAEGDLAMANEETRMEIKFTTTNSTVIIAWGGHIATKLDWGEGNSATGVSGSPYHMRLISIDDGGGNQDRSLQAGAVISPPSCPITGPTNVCADTTNVFFASTDIGTNFLWSITNNTSGAFIVGLSNKTDVTVASGTGGSFLLQILVGSNFLSSVCEKLVTVVSNTISVGPTNVALCTPSDVTFTTTPSGAGPFTFVWRRNGTLISGATNSSLTISNAMPANSGTYCVEVTGACNSATNCATLLVDTPPSIICPSNITVQCFADVPAPDTNSVAISAGANVTHEGDAAATNGCEIVITRTYKAVNTCGSMASCAQLITVRDTIPPMTCVTAPADMISWWPGDGNLNDIQGGNTMGTVGGGPTFAAGKVGQAFRFFGTSSPFLSIASPAANLRLTGTQVTLDGWINPAVSTNNAPLFGRTLSGANDYAMFLFSGQLSAGIKTTVGGELFPNTGFIPPTNAWTYVAMTYDGAAVKIYTNGVLALSAAKTGNIINDPSAPFNIGGRSEPGFRFNGLIDEVEVFSRALSAEEIRGIYNAGSFGKCRPISVAADSGRCDAVVNYTTPVVSDNCATGLVSICSPPPGFAFPVGTTIVTCATSDECNSVTNSFPVTVKDTQAPVISCPTNFIVECDTPWDFVAPTATDNCTNVAVTIVSTVTNTAGFCAGTFAATRTWVATDGSGNTNHCSQTVTVVDTKPPVTCVTPPASMVSWWPGDGTPGDIQGGNHGTLQNGASYAAGMVGQAFSFNGANQFVEVPNSASLKISSAITIDAWVRPNDNLAEGALVAVVTKFSQSATCGSASAAYGLYLTKQGGVIQPVSYMLRPSGALPGVSGGATPAGVFSHVAVTYDGASGLAFLYVNGQQVGTANFGAGGICSLSDQPVRIGQDSVVSRPFSGLIDEVEIFNRALSSNEVRAIFNAGSLGKCKPLVVAADAGQCSAVVNFPAGVSDYCATNATINCLPASGSVFPLGTTLVTCIASDGCNAVTNTFPVTVKDIEPPSITCATNRTVECGDTWNFDPPAATDNCTNVTVRVVGTETNALCGATFSATRTWEVTDGGGNTNRCSQTITVTDTLAPVLVGVPTNLTLRCLGDVPPPATVTAIDACDTNVTVTFKSRTYGPCPTVIERTWTATDACSNSVSATQTIFIEPDQLQVTGTPTNATVCPGGTATFCVTASANCPILFQWYKDGMPIIGATNACLTLTNAGEADEGEYCVRINGEFCLPDDGSFFVPAGAVPPGTIHCARLTVLPVIAATPLADVTKCPGDAVTFCTTVSGPGQGDAALCPVTFVWTKDGQVLAGQTNSCLVLDSVAPASAGLYCVIARGCCNSVTNCARLTVPSNMIGVACPKNKKEDCDDGWDFDEPRGTNVSIVIVGTETNQLCGRSYTAIRTWLIGDQNCGSLICTQKVTVEASLDIDCGPDKTVACGQSWDFDEPEAEGCNDDLDVDILYTTTTTLADGSVQHTRKWRVRDECGNEDTCKQIITVRSGAPASVVCAPDKTVECGSEWSFDPPAVSGGTLRIVHTLTNGACGGAFSAARLWEVTDSCGGSVLCNQVVTIVDTIAPLLLKCPTNLVIECGPVPPPAMVFAVDAVSAAPGPQIVLTNENIIGGSGSWENTTWNDPAGDFNAFNIVDNQTGLIAEPSQDNYWLGPETGGTQHIVIDLGKLFLIDRIELFNTHNHVFDDRGTKDFQIHAAHAVTSAGVNGLDLSGTPDLILSNRLAFQPAQDDPIEAETFTAANGLAPCAAYRYLRFEALSGHGTGWAGLNEIRIYGRMVCDTNVPVHFTETRADGLCPQSYTITRTWGAADDCGNSDHCTQIITVVDTTPPVITCLPDGLFQSVTQVPACPKTLSTFLAAGGAVIDACDTNLYYLCEDGPLLPSACGGVIERRHMVIDSCGNSNTCVQLMRIVEVIPPAATPLADLAVCAGATAAFTTTVSGSGPFHFVWRHNGVLLSGETNNTLSIPAAGAASAGSYSVEITGPCGSITHSATLTLAAATTASPPADLTRNTGESATFSIIAAGDGPMACVWRHNGVVLAGQSGASLTLPSVTQADAGAYTVEVSGRCNTVTNSAMLTVIAPEPFLAQLISHWKLDEGGGLLARDSVGSNHGDLIEGPLHCGGILGGALSLDGSDDCVEVPHSASLNLSNHFSISFWLRPAHTLGAASGRRELVNKCFSYCVVLNAATNDGRLVFAFNNGSPAVKSTTASWPANRWSHVVCVQDGANLRLYVNGVLEGTAPAGALPRVIGYPLLFGGDPEQGGFFAGSLDDVRLYSTNLPPAAIATMFNSGSTAYYTPANLTVSVQRETGRAMVNWAAVAGVRYRVEYKNDLGAAGWTALPDDVMATGSLASKEDVLGANQRRFYRVIALP